MRLIDADALLMNMNLAIAILEGTMKNLGLQDDAECQMELKAYRDVRDGIKDEPTIEPTVQPESDCVLKEFGDCSYSETGCSDCKVKEKIRNALSIQSKRNRPHWIISSDGYYPYCSECKSEPKNGEMTDFCPNCGADMRKENES